MKKKYLWFTIFVVIFTIFYFIWGNAIDNSNARYREELRKKSMYGKINYLNEGSRGRTSFMLNGQKQKEVMFIEADDRVYGRKNNLYQIAELGDSIAKDTNTAYFKLIKKNGELIWFKLMMDY